MPKTFKGNKVFTTNFDVQTTRPLDVRLVVDSKADLTNGSITAPYQGMVVNIAGTSELWILKTTTIEESYEVNEDGSPKNWELVTGSGSGSGLSKYSLPVMTPEMVAEAEADEDIDFDGSEDPYILVENDFQPSQSQGDAYLSLIRDMAGAIKALQAEVTRLRNTFEFGIDSYTDTKTAKSRVLSELNDVTTEEPLWALDPGVGLIMVQDNNYFNTGLDANHTFVSIGKEREAIDTSIDGQLTFVDCKGRFYDGNESGAEQDKLTLYKLTDSKLITYLVTDRPTIKMTLVSLDNREHTREIDFSTLIGSNMVNRYGFCVVLSRKVKDSTEDTYNGFNYIYFSIINYDTNTVLAGGYLTNEGFLVNEKIDSGYRYSIESIEFDRLTLSRMKFYTKFEDFSEEVIPLAPNENDYKYEVAHIAIRSVKNKEMLDTIADQLKNNELIWNKETNTLHIKSDGKIYSIGSNKNNNDNDDNNMTDRELIEALNKMGIIVNVEYKIDAETGEETDEINPDSLSKISIPPISDITFINEDTSKKFTFTVDPEGNLIGKDKSAQTIAEYLATKGASVVSGYETPSPTYKAVRGFASDYLLKKTNSTLNVNATSDLFGCADRLRISSFYAPISTDEKHGCTHSFIELENTSSIDIPLTGVYLHFFNPAENTFGRDESNTLKLTSDNVHHLELDGVIKAGSTYLIRGAKHAEFDDESAFIKVKTYDKEWYENGQLISFEQIPGKLEEISANGSTVPFAYRFCLTYGLSDLSANKKLVEINNYPNSVTINNKGYDGANYPNIIVDPRFIDSCSFSTILAVAILNGPVYNPWYPNGSVDADAGSGITITPNSMFRLMFALDPAKQAFNGLNKKDSSRSRYNKATDIQVLNLDKEYIGFPFSKETIRIDRYTPKASFENRNVMTDKSQLNREKPNMVTCSFGVDVYNTRCFNWISCGAFDECVWIREKDDENPKSWNKFDSYTKVSSDTPENHTKSIYRKEYLKDVNNAIYARMINRFPGNGVLFTSHKCVVVLPDATSTPVVYEYVVGRPDKDGKPDPEHTNDIFTFTIYPRSYEGRVYQVTDQQGFHWIEYQVWAASAEFLNNKIASECSSINSTHSTKVFPILINTGDMTQSGARINEWLDYYNGGISLFNHLEQMNCVGNNDLCPIDPTQLGTGDDNDKSSSHFFHYFYCFDVRDTEKCIENDVSTANAPNRFTYTGEKFFTGESLVVKAHNGSVFYNDITTNISITEDKYIPSLYYFKTKNVLYIVVNSEIPESNCKSWFGLCSDYENKSNNRYLNIYTGIETNSNGNYFSNDYFTPVYETIYAWLKSNQDEGANSKKVVVAMHEMPFTVITRESLSNTNVNFLPCTRNHPTNKAARVGSNVNQLNKTEDRGLCWCSRLLEWFNCKLVIGGHKHTYALSYPIREKYSWREGTLNESNVYEYETNFIDSSVQRKPMGPSLADEAGSKPKYDVSWKINLIETSIEDNTKTNRVAYYIGSSVGDNVILNSTKTPYVPENLYNTFGKTAFENSDTAENSAEKIIFRCCTPLPGDYTDGKYDNFVTYSMCQATGYKLKSNKELPSKYQVFSKIIPETKHQTDGTDKPSANQLYSMYSVLEFSDDCSELFVSMNRITGIFATLGKDTFNQGSYGKGSMGVEMLCSGDDIVAKSRIYGKWVDEETMAARNVDKRYVHIKF